MSGTRKNTAESCEQKCRNDPVDVALEIALEIARDDELRQLIRRAQQRRVALLELDDDDDQEEISSPGLVATGPGEAQLMAHKIQQRREQ